MAMTLAQSALLSTDILQAGVIELFIKDDPILEILPFIEIVGNSLEYNIEETEATAEFHSVNETWTENIGTVSQANANLKILGGDADIDNFLMQTRSNVNDLKGEALKTKVKAVKKQFLETFYYGYDGVVTGGLTAKQFNGIQYLISSQGTNTGAAATSTLFLSKNVKALGTGDGTVAVLTMHELEEAVDKVKGYKPDLMLMSKQLKRYINVYLRGAGGLTYDDLANKRVQTLFGVPVTPSEHISDNENCNRHYSSYGSHEYGFEPIPGTHAKLGDGSTSIFIVSFDAKAVCGLQNGIMETIPVGDLETKDAKRFRIKWYCSLMLQNILSCSKVTGIDADGAVGA